MNVHLAVPDLLWPDRDSQAAVDPGRFAALETVARARPARVDAGGWPRAVAPRSVEDNRSCTARARRRWRGARRRLVAARRSVLAAAEPGDGGAARRRDVRSSRAPRPTRSPGTSIGISANAASRSIPCIRQPVHGYLRTEGAARRARVAACSRPGQGDRRPSGSRRRGGAPTRARERDPDAAARSSGETARERRGEPPINAVWLWGGGRLERPTVRPFQRVRGQARSPPASRSAPAPRSAAPRRCRALASSPITTATAPPPVPSAYGQCRHWRSVDTWCRTASPPAMA